MLSDAQIASFETNGYLVVDDVLDQHAILDPVRAEYDRLLTALYDGWLDQRLVPELDDSAGFDDRLLAAYRAGCDWFQPMDISLPGDRITVDTPFHFGPAVFDMITAPSLLDIVEQLIGPELTSNPIQHVRIKPPATDLRQNEIRAHVTATDWHQDRGVTHSEADQTTMVTVWIAVSDASVDNGCLQVVEGGHREGILPHCPKTQTAIADGFVDEAHARPLPVKSGGVVVLHPLIPHGSLTNHTPGFRWSFDIRFNRTGEPTGRSHFPEFVTRSHAAPQSELRDWRQWKAMWEEARSQLAEAPHVDIHRWRSDSPACA